MKELKQHSWGSISYARAATEYAMVRHEPLQWSMGKGRAAATIGLSYFRTEFANHSREKLFSLKWLSRYSESKFSTSGKAASEGICFYHNCYFRLEPSKSQMGTISIPRANRCISRSAVESIAIHTYLYIPQLLSHPWRNLTDHIPIMNLESRWLYTMCAIMLN